MRIAVIEADYHVVDLDGFCRIFYNSTYEIIILTTATNYQRLQDEKYISRYKWILKKEESLDHFFATNLHILQSCDLIYFNTVASRYRAYIKLKFDAVRVMRIHNVNNYLQPWKHLYISADPFYLYKAASYFFRETLLQLDWFYLPKILRKIDFYCFVDKSIETYVRQHHYLPESKIFPSLPISVAPREFPEFSPTDTFRFCITGLIDSRKRNYEEVLKAFELAAPQFKHKVELVLLGRPVGRYGKEIIRAFKSLESSNLSVISFNQFVDQNVYNDYLSKAHLLISPIREKTFFRIFKEIYGKTKFTGSIGEMVKFGLLSLFPKHISFDTEFQQLVDQYANTSELSRLIIKYAEQPGLLKTSTEQFRKFIQSRYNAENILKEVQHFLEEHQLPNKVSLQH